MTVTSLSDHQPESSTTQVLERYLELSQSGELTGVLILGLHTEGAHSQALAGRVLGLEVLGSLRLLELSLTTLLSSSVEDSST